MEVPDVQPPETTPPLPPSPPENTTKSDDSDPDTTIHAFNMSNVTVIEKESDAKPPHQETVVELDTKVVEITIDVDAAEKSKSNSCEGSDSGVEVLETAEGCLHRAHSANSENVQEFRTLTPARSYESSIISYGSNYDEAYNILARRNSTLFEDYKLRAGDGTSEGGSESSSVASMRDLKRSSNVGVKKKIVGNEKMKKDGGLNGSRLKMRGFNQKIPNPNTPIRNKPSSIGCLDKSIKTSNISKNCPKPPISSNRTKPDSLNLTQVKKDPKKSLIKPTSIKTPNNSTPTTDGRWPSSNTNQQSPFTRSIKSFDKSRLQTDARNTLEKYATLPRRRREKSADNIKDLIQKKPTSRDNSMTRSSILPRKSFLAKDSTPSKSLPPYPRKKATSKTRIYHETSVQTALTITDIEKVFSGINVAPVDPTRVEQSEFGVQVDDANEELSLLKCRLKEATSSNEELRKEREAAREKLEEAEKRLKEESLEKEGLKDELRRNTERVLAILGGDGTLENDENPSSDSLLMLESRFQNVSQVIINQENEISKLNAYCRSLQRELDKSVENQRLLLQQQKELQEEGLELKNFMQEEKNALSDALKEAEDELRKYKALASNKDEKCKQLVKMEEHARHEMYSMQARLSAVETKGRELLVHQGSNVSGAAVALTGLISRLDGLLEELVLSYNISQQDLDDVVFHNEMYSNSSSSPEASPGGRFKSILKDKTPSPIGGGGSGGSSFISAVINAIRNATSQTPFSAPRDISKDTIYTDNSNSSEMLDSETEPCLMMEPVLEDVVVPDGHSHNMISSAHGVFSCPRLTRSESLTNLSQAALLHRQTSEQQTSTSLTESLNCSFTSDLSASDPCPAVTLVDQVIEVDNLITKLLKVIRIVQMDSEQAIAELQDERDAFAGQVTKHKDTNKVVVKQLQDWEVLGARLKTEVKELLEQLGKKNHEMEDLRCELNNQHKEVERLNQDVCELSTALSKAEHEAKLKDEESEDALKKWEAQGDMPPNEILGRILIARNDADSLKSELTEKKKQLAELQDIQKDNRRVLSENIKRILSESKKQYDAIDTVLGILHEIQPIVNQHPELIQVQQDLEKVCMLTASPLPLVAPPPDFNANAAIIQAMANLGYVI